MTDSLLLKRDAFIFRVLLAQVPILFISGLIGAQLTTFSIIAAVVIGAVSSLSYFTLRGTSVFGVLAAVIMMSTSGLLITETALTGLLLLKDWLNTESRPKKDICRIIKSLSLQKKIYLP